MSVDSVVRDLFGRRDSTVSDLIRNLLFNADTFINTVKRWDSAAATVLNVDCGEGAITQDLAKSYMCSDELRRRISIGVVKRTTVVAERMGPLQNNLATLVRA